MAVFYCPVSRFPFLLGTVVWFGFYFVPVSFNNRFFQLTVSRVGIFLKVTYSNPSLCEWWKQGPTGAETCLGGGAPRGKASGMTLRCRGSKLEPPSLAVPSARAGSPLPPEHQVFDTSYLVTATQYSSLPLLWNQEFALVSCAVSETDWNTALPLWGRYYW